MSDLVKINLTKARRIEKELAEDYQVLMNQDVFFEQKEESQNHDDSVIDIIAKAEDLMSKRLFLKNLIYKANQESGIVDLLNEENLIKSMITIYDRYTGRKPQRNYGYNTKKYRMELLEETSEKLTTDTKKLQRKMQGIQDEISRLNGITIIEVPKNIVPEV